MLSNGNRVTNVEKFRRKGEERKLWNNLIGRKGLIGNILRHDTIVKLVLEDYVEGKILRGTPRHVNLQQIMNDINRGNSKT